MVRFVWLSLAVTAIVHAQAPPAAPPDMQQILRELEEQRLRIQELEKALGLNAPKPPAAPQAAPPATTTALVPPPAQPTKPPAPAPAELQTGPLNVRIGDSAITPIGFMDLTNTFRDTNSGTSLQSNFASIPYNNTLQGRLSEDKITVANSRIGFRVDSKVKGWDVLGYFEGDFLGGFGNGNFNTQVTSNSLLFRVRLYSVGFRKDKWEFLGGQSWSMMVPNRRGVSALPNDLFYGLAIDTNYLNGLPWGRIPGGRVVYHPNDKWAIAFGVENSTQYFGGSGGAGVPVLPAQLASIGSQLDQNVANDIATPNVRPDIMAKIAYDPSARAHVEIAGVTSAVRIFNPVTNQTNRSNGYAGAINAGVDVVRNMRLVTNNFYGRGEGRYLFGIAPDFVVRPDGTTSMLPSGSTLNGIEYTHRNTLFYTYYGLTYVGRGALTDENGVTPIGYGFQGSPASHNRTTQEATAGFTQTIYRDPKVGVLQAMFQYEYLLRNPWFVAPGTPKSAHQNVVFFNLRWTLPGAPPR